jgi:hypothetical protein
LQVNLVRTEISTTKSKYIRDLADLREKLDRALSNNERDQTARDQILNDAKMEILTLSKKVSFYAIGKRTEDKIPCKQTDCVKEIVTD